MSDLAFSVDRTILIRASRDTVFRYFTDSERFARWWGEGSTIDPSPGGRVSIVYPGGATASGTVEAIDPPERIVFTYGYDDPSKPIAPGGSVVTISLTATDLGTVLHLEHRVADEATRDVHVPGWRYQLAVFARVAADEQHARAADVVDRYFAAWNEADAARRRRLLDETVAPAVTFADAFGLTQGADELAAHIDAARQHFAAATLSRSGDVRHAQGTALADWTAVTADGTPAMSGTNVFDLAPDGRIARIVGIG